MLFDAGRFGLVEVDVIEERPDAHPPHIVGILHPDDFYNKVMYHNCGKLGCARVTSHPPKVRSPEEKAKNIAGLLRIAEQVAMEKNLQSM